jgi:hypothetical protein
MSYKLSLFFVIVFALGLSGCANLYLKHAIFKSPELGFAVKGVPAEPESPIEPEAPAESAVAEAPAAEAAPASE